MSDPIITIKVSNFGKGLLKAVKVPSAETFPEMTEVERIIWALRAYANGEEFEDTIKLIDDLFN